MVAMGGIDLLHPGLVPFMLESGFTMEDMEVTKSRTICGSSQVMAYGSRGTEIECRARRAERDGLRLLARDLYLRATVLYARAHYHVAADNEIKRAYVGRMVECFEHVIEHNPSPIERVKIDVNGMTIYGILHLPARGTGKVPAVVLLPGADTIKEFWTAPSLRYFQERGMATLAIDGPGQGETRSHGVTAQDMPYPLAGLAAVSYLQSRPEIDADRIGVSGFSWGSINGLLIASVEPRVKAVAVAMQGLARHPEGINLLDFAQPHFITNFRYMFGMKDEAEIRATLGSMVQGNTVPDAASHVQCPFFLLSGEYDEVAGPLDELLRVWDLISMPKELWIYENQFHPLGPVWSEVQAAMADWLLNRLNNVPVKAKDIRRYLRSDGTMVEGDGKPLWRSPDRLLAAKQDITLP